jgi:hypothetical protein
MKTRHCGFFLICFSLLLVACTSRSLSTSSSFHELTATRDEASHVPGETPTLTLTFTPTYTSLPTATSTLASTATPGPTASLTPFPTLPQSLGEFEIMQLLQDNSRCKPPCFLGVTPGQTTTDELKNIFFHYGIYLHDYEGKGRANTIEQYPNSKIPPESEFHFDNGKVSYIRVNIDQSNSAEWSLYSPPALLKRLGVPSKVKFNLEVSHDWPPSNWGGYRITMFYDNLDFVIEYDSHPVKLEKLITTCPNSDYFGYAEILLGNYPRNFMDEGGDLEAVTTFTLESFRNYLLLGPGACFYLNEGAIPIY